MVLSRDGGASVSELDLTLMLSCGQTVPGAGRADHPQVLAGCAVRCPTCAGLCTVVSVGQNIELAAHQHREWTVDPEIEHAVGLLFGHRVPIGELAAH